MDAESYSVEFLQGQQTTLPFRVLVLAPLQANSQITGLKQPVVVNSVTFDTVLATLSPTIEVLTVKPLLLSMMDSDSDAIAMTFTLSRYEDFEPHKLIESQRCLYCIHQVMQQIHLVLQQDLIEYNGRDIDRMGLVIPLLNDVSVSRQALELLVCDLEHLLSDLLDSVLHDSQFQTIEAAWRGLYWLCQVNALNTTSEIMLMPMSKDILWDDLKHASSIDESDTYNMIYTECMGQFGGVPFGCVVLDDYFSGQLKDINILSPLLEICALSHVPLVTGVAAEMFSVANYAHIQDHYSITELFTTARYLKWRNFMATSQANFLSLTLPRLRFRERYTRKSGQLIWYNEDIGNDSEHCLWGNACFAMAANIIKRFTESGFCTFLAGDEGGRVMLEHVGVNSDKLPVEISIPEDKEAQLINLGFNPVITRPYQRLMLFPAANTLAWGNSSVSKTCSLADVASAQLHYLFIITRIIHCLKIVFRESLGATASHDDVSSKLNHWLKQYVSDVESPQSSILAERPLRSGRVTVHPSQQHEWFDIEVELSPHLKFMGNSVAINTDVVMDVENK